MPSQEFLNERFEYNKLTGVLTYKTKVKFTKIEPGDIAGSLSGSGYLKVIINKKTYANHKIIWKMVTGEDPPKGLTIDHADRDRLNNRWNNLRLATRKEQEANKEFTGVSKNTIGHLYQARIYIDGKRISLGNYETPEEAQAVYRAKCKEVRGEFAPY